MGPRWPGANQPGFEGHRAHSKGKEPHIVLQTDKQIGGTLADVIDRILDKGLIINADITVAVVGVELLGIKIRAALASFETAAMYGLEFPSGTKLPEGAGTGGAPQGSAGRVAAPSRNGHEKMPIPQL